MTSSTDNRPPEEPATIAPPVRAPATLAEDPYATRAGSARAAATQAPGSTHPAAPAAADDDFAAQAAREAEAAARAALGLAEDPAEVCDAHLLPGYHLLGFVAKGGMGMVFRARQLNLNRVVAVKMIRRGGLDDAGEAARFLAEARAIAKLQHPNIVAIYEIGQLKSAPYFSMEFVGGGSLSKRIDKKPLASRFAAQLMRKIALGVEYAHQRGVLHRDLKPANVLLDEHDEPKITDFGLATAVEEDSQLTTAGDILGTPSYMPPEQALGKRNEVTHRSDVYSLGATLYEMLAGRPPFSAATIAETLHQVIDQEPVSPRLLNPQIPRDLETICLKCLHKAPDRRYGTAQELADDLQRFLEDKPILARPVSPVERLRRWSRRNPVVAALVVFSALAVIATFVAIAIGLDRTGRALAKADENARDAMGVVDDLLTRVSEETLLNQPGMQSLRRDLLARALPAYLRLGEKLAAERRLPQEIALTQFRIGFVTLQIDGLQKAQPFFAEAEKQLTALHVADPQNLELTGNLALVHLRLGNALFEAGQLEQAAPHFETTRLLRSEMASARPDDAEFERLLANAQMNQGVLQRELGQVDASRTAITAAQDRRRELLRQLASGGRLRATPAQRRQIERDFAKGFLSLAELDLEQRDFAAAGESLRQALPVFQSLAELSTAELEDHFNLSICRRDLGELAFRRNAEGDLAKAASELEAAGEILRELVWKNDGVLKYRGSLAAIDLQLAIIRRKQGQLESAFTLLNQAFDELRFLRSKDQRFGGDWQAVCVELLILAKEQGVSLPQREFIAASLDEVEQTFGAAVAQELRKRAALENKP